MSQKSEMTLVLGGDLQVMNRFGDEMRTDSRYFLFLKFLEEADIVFVNLECTLTDYAYPALGGFKGDPALAGDIASLGIDIVSLANSHILDFGNEGLFDTVKALDQVSIKHVGAGRNLEEAVREEVIEKNGLRIGFLSFSAYASRNNAAGVARSERNLTREKPGLAPIFVKTAFEIDPNPPFQPMPGISPFVIRTYVEEKSLQTVLDKIREVKKKVDFLFFGVHWGLSFQKDLSMEVCEYQPPLAHAMVDAGVDVVVGHHPHHAHGLEIYKGKPIFYSLGNFLYHRTGKMLYERYGVHYHEQIFARVKIAEGKIAGVEVIPTLIDEKGLTTISDLKGRDQMLKYLEGFENIYKFGTKYVAQDRAVPIGVSV